MRARLLVAAFVLYCSTLPLARAAEAADPAGLARAVAPYLDDQAIAVAHIDLTRVNPAALVEKAAELLQSTPEERAQAAASVREMEALLAEFAKLGGRDVFAVLSLADIPRSPPFLIISIAPTGSAPGVARLLRGGGPDERDIPDRHGSPFEIAEPLGSVVFAGSKAAFDRLKTLRPAPLPNLEKAFAAAGDAAVRIAVVPTADNRRVIRETLPALPPEFGGGSGATLAEGIQWAAVGLNGPPKISVNLTIQSKDAESAAAISKAIAAAYSLAGNVPQVRQAIPKFDDLVKLATPAVQGDRLTLSINDENGGVAQLTKALTQPVEVAREAARRAQRMNNLKQLALAMHNYHDVHRKFPAAASYSKEGKPLLSWRVHVLPYIEGDELYRQFRLDEPWDSEHNRKLIEKMPKVFVNPEADLKEPGKTVYLVPTAEGTAFGGKEGLGLFRILDGTSNTIMIVEAAPERAVVWTRPDDLEVDLARPLAGLVAPGAKGFLTAFCDGSVRMLSDKIDLAALKALFTIAGGEAIDPSKF